MTPYQTASYVREEIARQPDAWLRAAGLAPDLAGVLPRPGESVAAIGCGTSWFMATAYAGLREGAGQGRTDAFAASELPTDRRYDRVVAISRSGTTTEVVRAVTAVDAPVLAITAVAGTPVTGAATDTVVLDFADERSVVQTVFATTTLMLLRASLGESVEPAGARAAEVLSGRHRLDPRWCRSSRSPSSVGTGPTALRRKPLSSSARRAGCGRSATRRWSTATGPSRSPSPAGPCG